MKNLFCELLPLDHKIKSLVVVDRCFNRLFGEIDLLFYLKTFLFFKIQKRHRAVSNNNQSNFRFKVLITYAVQCGILNAISKKHFRYSLFFKRIIAIDGTTSLFELDQIIVIIVSSNVLHYSSLLQKVIWRCSTSLLCV